MNIDPTTQLWLIQQDREREISKRALQRAAREGEIQQPGLVRGGISGLAKVVRRTASAAGHFNAGRPRSTTPLAGASER
jgi:hypothetical protein